MCTAYYSENRKLFMCNQIIGLSRHIFFDRWILFDPINVPLSTFSPALLMFCESSRNFSSQKTTTNTKQLLPGYVGYLWETPGLPSWLLRQSWWTLVGCSWNKCSSHGTRTAKCSIAGGGRGGSTNWDKDLETWNIETIYLYKNKKQRCHATPKSLPYHFLWRRYR